MEGKRSGEIRHGGEKEEIIGEEARGEFRGILVDDDCVTGA